jgi:hypothetical protein
MGNPRDPRPALAKSDASASYRQFGCANSCHCAKNNGIPKKTSAGSSMLGDRWRCGACLMDTGKVNLPLPRWPMAEGGFWERAGCDGVCCIWYRSLAGMGFYVKAPGICSSWKVEARGNGLDWCGMRRLFMPRAWPFRPETHVG